MYIAHHEQYSTGGRGQGVQVQILENIAGSITSKKGRVQSREQC